MANNEALLSMDADTHDKSWCEDEDPMVLGNIFNADKSVVIWQRSKHQAVENYFDGLFSALGLGIRGVYSLKSLKASIASSLPDGEGKQQVVDDIYLLSDMLITLFDCSSVGIRLVPLTSAMCPSFHVDNIPVRMVTTYLGPGTQWLPQDAVLAEKPTVNAAPLSKTRLGHYYQPNKIQQMRTFDVGLLKGKAWQEHEEYAAIHRSCPVDAKTKRVLLTLDPM